MNYSNFYYQYIDILIDKSEIENFLVKYPLTESRFNSLNVAEVNQLITSIFHWFKKNDLKVIEIFLINHRPGFKQDIHIDYVHANAPKISINIPLNPETSSNALIRMYDFIAETNFDHHKTDKVIYSKVSPEQVKKVTQYFSKDPVILNISKPHSAWNITSVIRGLLAFRFKKDPINLIKE